MGGWPAPGSGATRPSGEATIRVTDQAILTDALPAAWTRTDEWYDVRPNPRGRVTVHATVDESTYRGGGMGSDHPVIWVHHQGRGRAWYTTLGHHRRR